MRWCAVLALGVLAAGTARSQDAPDPKSDVQRLQGTWRVESWEEGGKALSGNDLKTREVFFGGNVFIFRREGKPYQAGTLKLYTTKMPKTFNGVVREGEGKDSVLLGLYDLKDDTLTLCFDPQGLARPAGLKPDPKGGATVVILKKPRPPADEQLEIVGKYRSELLEPNGKVLITDAIVERRGDAYQVTYRKEGKILFIGTAMRRGNLLSMCWVSAGQAGVSVYKIEKGPKLSGEYTVLAGIGVTGREVLTPWKQID